MPGIGVATPAARPCLAALLGLVLAIPTIAAAAGIAVEPEGAVLTGAPLHLQVTLEGLVEESVPVEVRLDGELVESVDLGNGAHSLTIADAEIARRDHEITVQAGELSAAAELRSIPGWLAVLPPLLAIALALLTRNVVVALFTGIFTGALMMSGFHPVTAFGGTVTDYITPTLMNTGNASILIFTVLIGGMIGIVSKSGGTLGIVERLKPFATTSRRGQVATWLMGIFIFFDDYANTLIVGNTMRPITDRLRISREKLAYIVDSTAAPVACIMPISTWIGFEVGLISAALTQLDVPYSAYPVFVSSIPYRFYPIFALVLVLAIAISQRDFGPMLKAERRARTSGKLLEDDANPLADYSGVALEPPDEAPRRAINAVLPILTVIAVTIWGLFQTGSPGLDSADYPSTFKWVQAIFSNANSSTALLWASLSGAAVALVLCQVQRILKLHDAIEAMIAGFKAMLPAVVVLVMAWALGAVCGELHTADVLVGMIQGVVAPHWLPVLVFVLAAITAFSTGTSWGTMGILTPLVIPLSHGLLLAEGTAPGSAGYTTVLLGTVSSVLAGAVWGDHCSPISDTTILSSIASGSDHIAHVRTQLPYALGIGVLGMLVGDIPTAFGMPPWIALLVGTGAIVAGVVWLGRPQAPESDEIPEEAASPSEAGA